MLSTSNSSDSVEMIEKENSTFKHEEADCNIISCVQFLIHEQKQSIQVIADDTDIFVLLVSFCWKWQAVLQITMKKSCGQVIDINTTAVKPDHTCSHLLEVHAITGCDTISYMFGKRKGFSGNNHSKNVISS